MNQLVVKYRSFSYYTPPPLAWTHTFYHVGLYRSMGGTSRVERRSSGVGSGTPAMASGISNAGDGKSVKSLASVSFAGGSNADMVHMASHYPAVCQGNMVGQRALDRRYGSRQPVLTDWKILHEH